LRLFKKFVQAPMCHPEPTFLSPRAYFFCPPELPFLSPRASFFVTPSFLFLSPRALARGPSALARLGKTQREAVAPSLLFFVTPSLLFCRPERSEGSIGACAPQEDRVGNVAPSFLFLSPRGVSRGVSLGTPSRRK
jgi:hypothetical protein